MYCTQACRRAAINDRRRGNRTDYTPSVIEMSLRCDDCQSMFRRPSRHGRPPRWCPPCAELRKAAQNEQWFKDNPEYHGEHYVKNRATYRAHNRSWKAANPEFVRESSLRHQRLRRVRMAGVAAEPYTLREIGERDAWVCHLCSEAIDPALRYPDQASSSVDHLVPISRGGPDTRANVKISHWLCNVRRNVKPLGDTIPAAP
jgi:5-methylcytosine-specific restriction endonuclease McrA